MGGLVRPSTTMQDLTYLKIDHLIIHELPKHPAKDGVLSDAVTPLSAPIRHFFEERIRSSLRDAGLPSDFVVGHSSPVPAQVQQLLGLQKPSKKAVVDSSRTIASHLFEIQTGAHSEGLIGIAACSLQAARGLAIIKLEHEEGVRAKLKGPKGSQHFEIEILDDLMLTKHTRVFKVALFAADPGEDVEALVCDSQRQRAQLVATYFLDKFLGCELLQKPDLATKAFLEAAETYINKSVADPLLQSRYHTALLAELSSNHTTVRAKSFADHHLEQDDRAPFLKKLKEAGVATTFRKDPTLVKARISRTRLDFDGNVTVTMPPDALDKSVKMKEVSDGQTQLQIQARLEGIRGAR